MSNPKLWLNRSHLLHNLRFIKKRTRSDFLCPMVKANAYGVGDSIVVSTLLEASVKSFGVARVFEAEKLRRFFPNQSFDVLVFHPLDKESLASYINNKLTPVISNLRDLELLESLSSKERESLKPLHIKFDLGMSRLGFYTEHVQEVKKRLAQLSLRIGGVCGHFPKADDYGTSLGESEGSLKKLIEVAECFGVEEPAVHAPNSEALIRGDFNVGLRPGISLYGVSEDSNFKGALKLTAPIVAVNSLSKGQKVSYGGLWEAQKPSNLGVLPIGYADGLRRGLSGKVSFDFQGQAYNQVGNICMDYSMVEFDLASKLSIGSEMTLFDENLKGLYTWAQTLKTLPYEILTGLGDRVERKVL